MWTFFKVIRWFFYFLSIVTGFIYLRGEDLFDERAFEITKTILIPGYLVFCGFMLWYLIATFWVWNEKYKEDVDKERVAIRSFLIGSACWIAFALIYIFAVV